MQKSSDLKPCPFCGGKKLLVTGMKDPIWHLYPAEIICTNCDAAVVFQYVSKVEQAQRLAVEAWNRRENDES
jgi:Lar family restriction alleviation protein